MAKKFSFSFSLSGVNPNMFGICQFIWHITNMDNSRFCQSFLAILGDTQVVPFFTRHDLQRMTMCSGSLKVLLHYLTCSGNRRLYSRIIQMILRRIVNRLVLQVGAPEIERCMRVFSSYIAQSQGPRAISYPVFNPIPCADSIRMLLRLRKVHYLPITPRLIDRLDKFSKQHYDQGWKSIWTCGLYWIVKMSSIIQNGNPFLNFVIHSVIHRRQDCIDSFLSGDRCSELQEFWVLFENMRGRYVNLGRAVSFSRVLLSFLEILEDPQFFRELSSFLFSEFLGFQGNNLQLSLLEFCQSMINSSTEKSFGDFFYPRVFVICKFCKAKICYSRHLKSLRQCENCVSHIPSHSDDEG